jgi:lipopolysaccharide transport system permease protein
MNENEHVYTPNYSSGWGLHVWQEMIREAIRSRELIWRLFIRDFSARYRQTVLGAAWAVIPPIIAVGTFVLLSRSGILNVGVTVIPYPVYALMGLTIWQLFAGGVIACSNAIVTGGSMVIKINFPKETLVIAAIGQATFELIVRAILLAIVMTIFRIAPMWTIVFFPFTLLPLLIFTLGLGFFFGLVNVMVRDVGNVVGMATSFLMFLTPVLYPAPQDGLLAMLMRVNPLAGLVTASRDMVFTGYLTDAFGFAWAAALALFFFFFAWRLFHLVEPRMAERI